jgi:hypothetical protein
MTVYPIRLLTFAGDMVGIYDGRGSGLLSIYLSFIIAFSG